MSDDDFERTARRGLVLVGVVTFVALLAAHLVARYLPMEIP